MSLHRSYLSLAVIVLMVCSDNTLCAITNRNVELGVSKSSDKVDTGEFILGNRTYKNETALETQQIREVGVADIAWEFEETLVEETRKKKQNKNQQGFMERILPMMIIPFMVSTSFIPIMLTSLKFMILKSAFIGKIAILLILINMFRRRTSGEGGVFNHNISGNEIAMQHYGYHGDEEYGAYINRRRRKRSFH